MTETPEDFRRRVEDNDAKFHEQLNKRGEPYRFLAFEYEKLAVEFSHRSFQLLTYLNGGALVAIPTALAFFKADVGRSDVLLTAGAFIAGLLFVVIAQVAAFFTMAKRAEASFFYWSEQFQRVAAHQYPHQSAQSIALASDADKDRTNAIARTATSNILRQIALIGLGFSLGAFVAGCAWGASVVLFAKEAADRCPSLTAPAHSNNAHVWLHRTVPAVEGGATTVRPDVGS